MDWEEFGDMSADEFFSLFRFDFSNLPFPDTINCRCIVILIDHNVKAERTFTYDLHFNITRN